VWVSRVWVSRVWDLLCSSLVLPCAYVSLSLLCFVSPALFAYLSDACTFLLLWCFMCRSPFCALCPLRCLPCVGFPCVCSLPVCRVVSRVVSRDVSRVVSRDVPCPLGVSGIRTHDGSLHFCFQDRRIRPLCHHAFPLSFLLFPSPLLLFVFLHFLLFFLCFPFFSLIYFLFFLLPLLLSLLGFCFCVCYSDFAFHVPNFLPLLLSLLGFCI
jgi:hypothetical protein